jgi:hypothetical protein
LGVLIVITVETLLALSFRRSVKVDRHAYIATVCTLLPCEPLAAQFIADLVAE